MQPARLPIYLLLTLIAPEVFFYCIFFSLVADIKIDLKPKQKMEVLTLLCTVYKPSLYANMTTAFGASY